MAKIYVVTDGEYSDYHIVGVFSTEENARLCEEFSGGDIEEWELDANVKRWNQGLMLWFVIMLKDGTVKSCERTDYIYEDGKPKVLYYDKDNTCLDITVGAKDKEHAIKIVNEKRAMIIAMNEWKVKIKNG